MPASFGPNGTLDGKVFFWCACGKYRSPETGKSRLGYATRRAAGPIVTRKMPAKRVQNGRIFSRDRLVTFSGYDKSRNEYQV